MESPEGKAIVYKSGKVVFHSSLRYLILSSLIEEPGVEVGSDEAGKGEDEGAIVVAAVALDESARKELRSLGLLESKSVPRSRIPELFKEISARALHVSTKVVTPEEFRSLWKRGNLNDLLANWHKQVIKDCLTHVTADRVIVDSFDRKRLEKVFSDLRVQVILEAGADKKYVSVAAASLIAKYLRGFSMRGKKWS